MVRPPRIGPTRRQRRPESCRAEAEDEEGCACIQFAIASAHREANPSEKKWRQSLVRIMSLPFGIGLGTGCSLRQRGQNSRSNRCLLIQDGNPFSLPQNPDGTLMHRRRRKGLSLVQARSGGLVYQNNGLVVGLEDGERFELVVEDGPVGQGTEEIGFGKDSRVKNNS